MISAKHIMTATPSCCENIDSIFEVVRVMDNEQCGIVPIVDSGERLLGVVTDRDVCLRVVLQNLDPHQTEAGDIMSTDILTCRADDDIEDVVSKMEKKQVRRIIVVDDFDRVAGIISEGDIARETNGQLEELVQAVVQETFRSH